MKKVSPFLLSILTGVLLVIFAYRLDLWSYHLRPSAPELSRSLGEQAAWMLPAYLAEALLAGLLLTWSWFTHLKVPNNRTAAVAYLVLGLVMPVYGIVIVEMSMAVNSAEFVIHYYVPPFTLASFASLWMMVFGLQRLVFGQSAV